MTHPRSVLLLALITVLLATNAAQVAASEATDSSASLVEQVDLALKHASFALTADNDEGFRNHAHHVVNILVGESGTGFDDSFGNPGDGYGALEYARDLRANADISAAGWQEAAQNTALWLEQAAEEALQAASAADDGSIDAARDPLIRAVAFISAAKGREGESAPVAGALSLNAALSAAEPAGTSGGDDGYY